MHSNIRLSALSVMFVSGAVLAQPAQVVEYNPNVQAPVPVQEAGIVSYVNGKFNQVDRSIEDLGDRADRAENDLSKLKSLEARIAELEKKLAKLETMAVAPAANAQGSSTTGDSASSAPMSAADVEASQAAYKKAFDLLMAGKYAEAGTGFKSFIEKYPTSDQLSNAHYWMGETQFINRKFDVAVKSYEQAAKLKGAKEADALVKQAQCMIELKQTTKAQEVLESVKKNFADSSAAKQADKLLASLKATKK